MTDHAPSGLVRPDDNAPISTMGGVARQHANSFQVGTFTLTFGPSDTSTNVPFPEAFAAEPVRVVCSPMTLGLWPTIADMRWGKVAGSSAGDGSATGFVFQARRTAGANVATMRVNYIAVGQGTMLGG